MRSKRYHGSQKTDECCNGAEHEYPEHEVCPPGSPEKVIEGEDHDQQNESEYEFGGNASRLGRICKETSKGRDEG